MDKNLPEINVPFDIVKNDTDTGKRLYGALLCAGSGDVRVSMKSGVHILEKGDIAYIRPMLDFSVSDAEFTELRFDIHTLDIPLAYAQRIYHALGEDELCEDLTLLSGGRKDGVKQLISALSAAESAFSMRAYADLLSLLSILADGGECPEESEIHSISRYIDSHSAENLEAAALAEMCGMSYPNFARRFHELYGRSCKEHISHVRTVKARRLLMETDLDLSVIAAETGFFDSSHLIRTYKKLMGTTPSRERRYK